MICWGRGENGELGTNNINNEYSPILLYTSDQITQCSAGISYTLFLSG